MQPDAKNLDDPKKHKADEKLARLQACVDFVMGRFGIGSVGIVGMTDVFPSNFRCITKIECAIQVISSGLLKSV